MKSRRWEENSLFVSNSHLSQRQLSVFPGKVCVLLSPYAGFRLTGSGNVHKSRFDNFPELSAHMNSATRTWKTCRLLTAVCLLTCVAASCNLLVSDQQKDAGKNRLLAPVIGPQDAIEIEVYYVDRRVGDSFIGESLWSALHRVNAIDGDSAAHLNDDGFRIAMSASRPPRELTVLMWDSDEQDPTRREWRQQYTIPAGQEMTLIASEIPNGTIVRRKNLDGETHAIETNQARSVFRIQADKVEDGWTRLVVIPEIQYGRNAARPVPKESEWIYHEGQQAMTFYEDRITAELNEQEILVLGLQAESQAALAGHFFQADPTSGLERLILIRITGMSHIEPVRQEYRGR